MRCMTYQERQDWLRRESWRMAGELMKLNPIDRIGLVAELPRAIEEALKKREKSEL
jgi:hypothetical protein